MLKANPPIDLTPEMWLVKLLMGGIDSSYDELDQVRSPVRCGTCEEAN